MTREVLATQRFARTFATGLCTVWLLWRGAAGAWDLGRDVVERPEVWTQALTLDLEGRTRVGLADWDKLKGLPTGTTFELVEALRKETPERGLVWVVGLQSLKQGAALAPAGNLCFPRLFRADNERHGADWVPPEGDSWLLFDPALTVCMEGRKTRLASGRDWSLWR